MPPPPLVSSTNAVSYTDIRPAFEGLNLPMRWQDPSDPSCGVQALGMALDGLGGSAPSSNSLWSFLEGRGMTYAFGTGVEELAHAAQSFGYAGSLPFHQASLDDLSAELAAGRPVVVALGGGEGAAGHFATLTGISPDGGWVSYNDPTLGTVVLPSAEFLRLWEAQGSSGVRVAREALATPAGEFNAAPWVAMAAGLMALVSTTPLVLGRKGIGGKLDPGGASGGSTGKPPYAPPAGYRWVKKLVTRYKTAWVQDGWTYENRTVPRYEKQRVQVGTMTIYDKIPQYKTIRVQDGWKSILERVPQYKTVRYVKYYRTTQERVKRYRYVRGRRTFVGYSYITKRTPVYGTKKVFDGYKKVTKQVPNYVEKRVLNGYKVIEIHVPKYELQDVKVGWTTEKVRVPKMVQVRNVDGVDVKWELERVPQLTATPTPTPTPPHPTESPLPIPTVPLTATQSLLPSSTPTAEEILNSLAARDQCDIYPCETFSSGTYIGDNPFEIDDSIGPSVPLPSPWGIVFGIIDLTNTFGSPYAYGEFINQQENNVLAQLTVSQNIDGKTVDRLVMSNQSNQPLKIIVNVQNSHGTITQVGPSWVLSGESTINLYQTIMLNDGSTEPLFIAEGGSGRVDISVIASYNDPLLIRSINFTIPSEE